MNQISNQINYIGVCSTYIPTYLVLFMLRVAQILESKARDNILCNILTQMVGTYLDIITTLFLDFFVVTN